MFKKKRNALLEEMRKVAEGETVRVLESAGLISEVVRVLGVSGVRSKYVAKPAEDRAARALAEEAIADAQAALEAAGGTRIERIVREALAAQKLERETAEAYREADEALVAISAAVKDMKRPRSIAAEDIASPCGCRRFSSNDTLASELPSDWDAHVSPGVAQKEDSDTRGVGELATVSIRECRRKPRDLAIAHGSLHHVDHVSFGGVVDSSTYVLPVVVEIPCHCSSPVVAESEAATSDAPAMTVQEGGSSDAAPGVEGVSPASSTPRFVAVGEYVYDRAHNLVAGGWPGAVATKWARDLNADVNVAGYMEWEDAK